MSKIIRFLIAAAAGVVPIGLSSASHADDYKVAPVMANGAATGCMITSDEKGLGFIFFKANDSAVVVAGSKDLAIAVGDEVKGTWSIDEGAPVEFSSKATDAHFALIPVPKSDALKPIMSGAKHLDLVANGSKAQFDLAGAAGAMIGPAAQECFKSVK